MEKERVSMGTGEVGGGEGWLLVLVEEERVREGERLEVERDEAKTGVWDSESM